MKNSREFSDKGLSFSEKLSFYLIPYEEPFTTLPWKVNQVLEKKFREEIQEFENWGEFEKVKELKRIQKHSTNLYWLINMLIIISGLVLFFVI